MTKDIDEQPIEELHRARYSMPPSQHLGMLPSQHLRVFTWKLYEPHKLWTFMEASLCRHNTLTQSSASLPPRGWRCEINQ